MPLQSGRASRGGEARGGRARCSAEAGGGDRQAPDEHRADHDPAEPAGVLDPAGGEGRDGRAGGHARVEQAGSGRARVEDREREDGYEARGMPNVIAIRSIANEPISAWLRLTNSPSAIDFTIRRTLPVSVGAGWSLGSIEVTTSITTNPAAWAA